MAAQPLQPSCPEPLPVPLATLFYSPWEKDGIKAVKPCFERARNKPGLLCRKGHVFSIFQIHAACGISQLSGFNGRLQTGYLEYFDLFGHWADLQPAVLTAAVRILIGVLRRLS